MQYTDLIRCLAEGVKLQAATYADGQRLNTFVCVDGLNALASTAFNIVRPEIERGQAYIRAYDESGANDATLEPHYPAAALILDNGTNLLNDQCGKAVIWKFKLFAVDIMRANNANYFDSAKDQRTKHDIDNDTLAALAYLFMHLNTNGYNVIGQINYTPLEASLNQDVIRGFQASFSLRLDSVAAYATEAAPTIDKQQPNTITP